MSLVNPKTLRPVTAQPGRPLYLTVKEHVREAIDSGLFRPGEQMPSTKELSERLSVSLVTAHRALQELVASGVLFRAQGKGTFVHERYVDRSRTASSCRIGILLHASLSLLDYANVQILEGIRQASHNLAADVMFLRDSDDIRNECNGYLALDAVNHDLDKFVQRLTKKQPVLLVGASTSDVVISSVRVDEMDAARQTVEYLAGLGHARIGYVGGPDHIASHRGRWLAFQDVTNQMNLMPSEQQVVRGAGWRLDEAEQALIIRMLSGPKRPTAVVAASFHFALDAYAAANVAGLRVPDDLSIVGLDDPPSAAHLAPPLTTIRQPLVQLGQAAATQLCEYLSCNGNAPPLQDRILRGELIARRSAGPAGRKT